MKLSSIGCSWEITSSPDSMIKIYNFSGYGDNNKTFMNKDDYFFTLNLLFL